VFLDSRSDVIPYETPLAVETNGKLMRKLIMLAWPIVVEQVLHTLVGLNDTYLANHVIRNAAALPPDQRAIAMQTMADAAASVNIVTYLFWFFGLIVGSVGTGASVIIARAIGARHRSLANSVCGQAMAGGAVMGVILMIGLFIFRTPVAQSTRLSGEGVSFTLLYLKILAPALPFLTLMFIANACLRGAGDTLTPAVVFVVVDIVNMFFSWGFTYGIMGMPKLGYEGIAIGTTIAYILGGLIQIIVLIRGRGGIRLHPHRLRPHWHNLRRLLRIGIPNGLEGFVQWSLNYILIMAINQTDKTNISGAAHGNAVRIEAFSYLASMAIATAAATLVGQSLGQKNPHRAAKVTYLAYLLGGGLMTLWGLFFIFFHQLPAEWISDNPRITELTSKCLFATGFCQPFFAAAMIFGFAMRGAGDTLRVMVYSLASQVGLRLTMGLLAALVFGWGVVGVWWVLSGELIIRGVIMYTRFLAGSWKHVKV
jgi:putative MATE family efflux protein